MAMRTLPKQEWRSFFDRMSQALLGKWAEIEVASGGNVVTGTKTIQVEVRE